MKTECDPKNIDHDTFTRFAEYLYGNDYNPAEALVVLEQPKDSEASGAKCPTEPTAEPMTDSTITNDAFTFNGQQVAADHDWDFTLWTTSKKNKAPLPESTRNDLLNSTSLRKLLFRLCRLNHSPSSITKTAQNDAGLNYDHSEILSQVQLYSFTEQYQIENLQRIVLSKLRSALDQTKIHPQKLHDLWDILIMAYETTRNSDEKEPLRNLLTLFGAWAFSGSGRIRELPSL